MDSWMWDGHFPVEHDLAGEEYTPTAELVEQRTGGLYPSSAFHRILFEGKGYMKGCAA